MHSIWQEQMEFPVYPILKEIKNRHFIRRCNPETCNRGKFSKRMGRSVMIIEEKSIGDMPELGGMGILKATNMNEFKELCILKNYIIRQHIPCDLEIISETSIQVHPVKLFLFMTKDVEVYEQTKITARQGKRLDIESAYIDAGQVIEDDKPCEKRYIHVFSEAGFQKSRSQIFWRSENIKKIIWCCRIRENWKEAGILGKYN
mgnify:CR=1 FL=1